MSQYLEKATPKPVSGFVLASSSPRRRELLNQLIEEFEVVSPKVDELLSHAGGPIFLVQENALIKAQCVAQSFPSSWVLGSDTVVAMDNKVFGKPKDMKDACGMLLSLSDRWHEVHTGICLIQKSSSKLLQKVETSRVKFRALTQTIIEEYFSKVDPLDKAGGYAIQTRSDLIIDCFEGSKSNVIGLPLEALDSWFGNLGISSGVGTP